MLITCSSILIKLPGEQRAGRLLQLLFVFSLPGAARQPPVLRPAANTRRLNSESELLRRAAALTHGVSSMTLHTVAIVLKQSVVFSMGRFLFCWAESSDSENPGSVRSGPGRGGLTPRRASPPTQTWSCRRLMFSAWAWRRRRTGRCGWPARC